jgi:hypothetical protein
MGRKNVVNYLPKGLVEKLKELNEQGQIKKSDIILGILLGLVMTVLTIIGYSCSS